MSLDSCRTLFTLVPAAMSTSYIETVGPREQPVTRASTPNVWSVRSSAAMVSCSSRPSAVEGGAVRNRSSGGSWYGPLAVETVRAFVGRVAAGSGSSSGSNATSSASDGSGRTTTSSSGTSRPSASRIERRPGLARRGARSSASSSAATPTGSRSGRESRNSRIDSMMRDTGVPVKISRPSVANPRQTMPAPIGESTRDNGWAASAPASPAAGARTECGSKTPGLSRNSETSPRTPNTSTRNPMHIRTRSSTATSRSRTTPQ